jgi:hypothetical protein
VIVPLSIATVLGSSGDHDDKSTVAELAAKLQDDSSSEDETTVGDGTGRVKE